MNFPENERTFLQILKKNAMTLLAQSNLNNFILNKKKDDNTIDTMKIVHYTSKWVCCFSRAK